MIEDWKQRRRISKADALERGMPDWYSRGYLPHFDIPYTTQSVTFRLFDSMPQDVIDRWREELHSMSEVAAERTQRKRIDAYLDIEAALLQSILNKNPTRTHFGLCTPRPSVR